MTMELGRESLSEELRRLLAPGGCRDGRPGMVGAAPGGGFGAEKGLGAARPASPGSDRYDEPASAPVSMPARVFFSFGMPPAKRPASWGAESAPEAPPLAEAWPAPWSLLLRALLPGTGGARPPGGFGAPPMPGIGGAPPTGGPDEDEDAEATCGAERSFVTAFLRARPLWMSERRAPCT
jgi:hypothetical protein